MKIAIQGEPGSFSHEAALKLVPDAEIVPCALSAEVFAALDSGAADAAAIPIENSLAGSVLEHFDLLLHHDVQGGAGDAAAHPPQSDRRHGRKDRRNRPRVFASRGAGTVPALSGRASPDEGHCLLRHCGQREATGELRDMQAAAIASEQAAVYYGAEILARGIEDDAENYTRFFLVRPKARWRRSGDRSGSEQDEHGLYARAPARFAGRGA